MPEEKRNLYRFRANDRQSSTRWEDWLMAQQLAEPMHINSRHGKAYLTKEGYEKAARELTPLGWDVETATKMEE